MVNRKSEQVVTDKALDIEKDSELRHPGEEDIDAFGVGAADKLVSKFDDPELQDFWKVVTLRSILIGIGLSVFGGILGQIYMFKPQTIRVSSLFLQVIGYCLGHALAFTGSIMTSNMADTTIKRIIYPGPFNFKEHVVMTIMAATASASAMATEFIGVQDLYYNSPFTPVLGIILVLSSQMLGYGMAGLFRSVLVYPKKMFYPNVLSYVVLYESLHSGGALNYKRLKLFFILMCGAFVWCWVPEWIAPSLIGVSIFCLANMNSPTSFTRMFGDEMTVNKGGFAFFNSIFGGTTNNQGLGLFSLCFDWNQISSTCMTYPWATLINLYIGTLGCVIIMPLVYYYNVWDAQKFPFLAQDLFLENGTTYDPLSIVNDDFALNMTKYEEYGAPYFATTWAIQSLVSNLAITAAISHIILYNWKDLKNVYDAVFCKNNGEEKEVNELQDLMAKYPEISHVWYIAVLLLSMTGALVVIYTSGGSLPWWGFLVSVLLSALMVFFTGFFSASTGFGLFVQPLVQMVGGLINPGLPVANMYFTLYGYNSVNQAVGLLQDLKLGQYMKIPPRAVFSSQLFGALIGGLCNYFITTGIIAQNREVLKSTNGSPTWSGQNVQAFNSQSVTWGGLSAQLYGPGKQYFLVVLALPIGFLLPIPFYLAHLKFPKAGFNYVNTSILCYYLAYLTVGVNSSIFTYVIIGFVFQYYLRKTRQNWFSKYNYLIAAALDAGTQICVFVLTFAVQGGVSDRIDFPNWALNPQDINPDYCLTYTEPVLAE